MTLETANGGLNGYGKRFGKIESNRCLQLANGAIVRGNFNRNPTADKKWDQIKVEVALTGSKWCALCGQTIVRA